LGKESPSVFAVLTPSVCPVALVPSVYILVRVIDSLPRLSLNAEPQGRGRHGLHHGEIARIEIARDEMQRALTAEMFLEFTRIFKSLGFTFVTLDTEGFRSGSMNSGKPVQTLVKLIS